MVKIVAGFSLLVSGIAMLALPGPGWLAIAAGLALLADEFHWARRLSNTLKVTTAQFGHKLRRRHLDDAKEDTESSRSSDHPGDMGT
jgi:uncharacterized protein (TIGR02611 family)